MAPFSHYDEPTSKLLFDAFDAAWREVEVTNASNHGATKARLTRDFCPQHRRASAIRSSSNSLHSTANKSGGGRVASRAPTI